jgi:TonB family protein
MTQLARAFALLVLAAAAPLHAQGVFAGILQDPKTKTPLPCVEVSLEDSSAHEVAHGLTTSDGAFQFDSPAKGSYRPRFTVWNHAPVYGGYEALDPTTERARVYQVDFGPWVSADPKIWTDSADAPPGGARHPGKVSPQYPQDLKAEGVEGDVSVRYVVDSAGRVVQPSIQVLQTSRPEFAASAVRFLQAVEMVPARHAGRPVCALQTDVPFTYRLQRWVQH